MDFFWLFVYNLKYPVTIGAGIGLFLCVVMFLQGLAANNRSPSKSGDPRVAWSVISGIIFALIWMFIYAMPAPDYNVRYVEKPTVKVITKSVPIKIYSGIKVVEPTWDQRFKFCKSDPSMGFDIDRCTQYANMAKQPRIVERKVPVYLKENLQKLVEWCQDQRNNMTLDDCVDYGKKILDYHPRIVIRNLIREVPVFKGEKVIIQHDAYFDLWKKCNDAYSLERAPANQFGELRNQRMAICKDIALAGSR